MLPPERELAARFNVGYGTIRLANQLLIRRGLIARHQGRGSYVTRMLKPKAGGKSLHRRLGLLYVDQFALTASYNQELTFELQHVAAARGYQLTIEQLHTEDVMLGQRPSILDANVVDGLILSGAVRDPHVELMREKQIPFIVVGNTPISRSVPQVRIDSEGIAYDITAELIRAGRGPIWFDGDAANTRYHAGVELIAGYVRAQQELGDGSTYFCKLSPDRISKVAETLCRSKLDNAAYIVGDWSYPLLPTALRMSCPDADELMIVPITRQLYGRPLLAPNIVSWTRMWTISDFAEPTVNALIDAIEGVRDEIMSTTIEAKCTLTQRSPVPTMQARVVRRTTPPVSANALDEERVSS